MRPAFSKSLQTRRWLWLPCALLLLIFAGCGDAPQQSASPTASDKNAKTSAPPRTNLPMPPVNAPTRNGASGQAGWTLLDGRRMQLSDYPGQVVVLDFWATYCPPCLEEVPHLVAMQKRYSKQGFHVIGLNVGGAEDQPKIPDFVERFKVQYALGYPDPGTTEIYLGNDTTIPQTLVFDRKGKLVKHLVGFDKQVSAELEEAVQTALNTGD
jgi:thiol-disulfide isomerase/thioredoxin